MMWLENQIEKPAALITGKLMTNRIGKVYLVGAGPGDAGLLTIRGWQCLQEAHLVLYDGLVNPRILNWSRGEAVRSCRAGRSAGGDRAISTHPGWVSQSEINSRMIEAARNGQIVVRLKGGDPFIFGRGGEEAAALAEAGIPFEVVPGITAATAAAVYSGLSLTHRECASAVAFITGHEDPDKTEQTLNYQSLANFPGTLVFYMGLHRLETIARALIEAGKPAETPAMVVSQATTSRQQSVEATLADIAAKAKQANLLAPSLAMIGNAIRWRTPAAWFEERPLRHLRIAIPRPLEQGELTALECEQLGGSPLLMPTISISSIDDWTLVDGIIDRIAEFDWIIFTSVNGVRCFMQHLWERGLDGRKLARCRLAVIGAGTAAELEKWHLRADFVPSQFRGEVLAEELTQKFPSGRAIWFRANRGREVIPEQLQKAGWSMETAVVYRNEDVTSWPADFWEKLSRKEVDWIALSSPSMARNWKKLLDAYLSESGRNASEFINAARFVSISPVTTQAAIEAGLSISAEASVFTWEGIFRAIANAEGRPWLNVSTSVAMPTKSSFPPGEES